MTDIKGYRLYVNLGASQVRRRLKGFGHGVRRIQSAGKGRAVIIHTATGQHLEELEALFGDVEVASSPEDLQGD
jgi:DNA transformation protein